MPASRSTTRDRPVLVGPSTRRSPAGTYLAQHVGPHSAFELIEFFLGPQPQARRRRHPDDEAAAAEAAGLDVVDLRTARLRMEVFDIGAVVYLLRKVIWWVPDFTVERYEPQLRLSTSSFSGTSCSSRTPPGTSLRPGAADTSRWRIPFR